MMTALTQKSIGFQHNTDLALLTLKGIGLQNVTSHSYSWDNRQRKDSHCLLQYTLQGEGAVCVNHLTYPLKTGDAFLVDIPGGSHYYLPRHSSDWEFLYLEFSKESLPLLHKICRFWGPVFSLNSFPQITQQMMNLYQLALNDRITDPFENAKYAYCFWMDLLHAASNHPSGEISKIDYVRKYLDQHFTSPMLNLDMAAEHAGLSKYYLSREFHKKFGVSPGRYITEKRIHYACSLLMENTPYTLGEIAAKAGYSNNNYFGKAFRAAMGISPDQYRRQNPSYDTVKVSYANPRLTASPDK